MDRSAAFGIIRGACRGMRKEAQFFSPPFAFGGGFYGPPEYRYVSPEMAAFGSVYNRPYSPNPYRDAHPDRYAMPRRMTSFGWPSDAYGGYSEFRY